MEKHVHCLREKGLDKHYFNLDKSKIFQTKDFLDCRKKTTFLRLRTRRDLSEPANELTFGKEKFEKSEKFIPIWEMHFNAQTHILVSIIFLRYVSSQKPNYF